MASDRLGSDRWGMRLLRNNTEPNGTSHVTRSLTGSTWRCVGIADMSISMYQDAPAQPTCGDTTPALCPPFNTCIHPLFTVASNSGVHPVNCNTRSAVESRYAAS